jgi:hypothetical protein
MLYCAGPTMIDALGSLVQSREHALAVIRARPSL